MSIIHFWLLWNWGWELWWCWTTWESVFWCPLFHEHFETATPCADDISQDIFFWNTKQTATFYKTNHRTCPIPDNPWSYQESWFHSRYGYFFTQLSRPGYFRDISFVHIIRMTKNVMAQIGPFHTFHQIIEMINERLRMTASGGTQQQSALVVAMEFIDRLLCQCPKAIQRVFQESTIWPEKQRCGQYDDIALPIQTIIKIFFILIFLSLDMLSYLCDVYFDGTKLRKKDETVCSRSKKIS